MKLDTSRSPTTGLVYAACGALLLVHGHHACPSPGGFECQAHLEVGEMPAPTSAAAAFHVTLASTSTG